MNKNNNVVFLVFILMFIISVSLNFYFLNTNTHLSKDKFDSQENNESQEITFPDAISKKYDGEKGQNINVYEDSYNAFKNINNYEEYVNWRKKYYSDTFLGFLIKNGDFDLYQKFMSYMYDYYIDINEKEFIESISKRFKGNTKTQFLEFTESKYNEFLAEDDSLSRDDYEMDINIYYSSVPLEDALGACEILKNNFSEVYSDDDNSCEDKIYSYRATTKNKFCNNVQDSYKQKLCIDFLNYIN